MDVNMIQIMTVPVIVSTVYGLLAILKAAIKSERFNTFIPIAAVLFGSLLGVLFYFGLPELIPAGNVCAALIIGAASGWAATGAHQTVKQIKKGGNEDV